MDDINLLKLVLVEKRKTGKWLAEQLGKNPSTVSKWCYNRANEMCTFYKRNVQKKDFFSRQTKSV